MFQFHTKVTYFLPLINSLWIWCKDRDKRNLRVTLTWHYSPSSLFTSVWVWPPISVCLCCPGLIPTAEPQGPLRKAGDHCTALEAAVMSRPRKLCACSDIWLYFSCSRSSVAETLVRAGSGLGWASVHGHVGSCQYYPHNVNTPPAPCHKMIITSQDVHEQSLLNLVSSRAMSLPWQVTDNWRKKYDELLHQKPVFCKILWSSKDDFGKMLTELLCASLIYS